MQINPGVTLAMVCSAPKGVLYGPRKRRRKHYGYVLAKDGSPLMPTERHGKIRHMLRDGRAKCVRREPFTIQLTYDTPHFTQDVILGIDCGSKYVGMSATTKTKELFSAELELRTDVDKSIAARREFRRTRRNPKTRYRKARFNNRTRPEGWLPPSVQNKVPAHTNVISRICKFLPVTEIVLETGEFDTQKIDNPNIGGADYRHGGQYGFYNVKQYVFWRDSYTCQCCKGKSKDTRLNVHHIVHRADVGSDRPDNLATLCETCHRTYHAGKIALPKFNISKSLRDAAHMNAMRNAVLKEVRREHPELAVSRIYGYITKAVREEHGIAKTHAADARVICGHPDAEPLKKAYKMRKVRRHNRQIHKAKILKGGVRKRNQAAYEVKGFRLFDKVKYSGAMYFISGRRTSGYFALRTLDGKSIPSISYRKVRFIAHQSAYITAMC